MRWNPDNQMPDRFSIGGYMWQPVQQYAVLDVRTNIYCPICNSGERFGTLKQCKAYLENSNPAFAAKYFRIVEMNVIRTQPT